MPGSGRAKAWPRLGDPQTTAPNGKPISTSRCRLLRGPSLIGTLERRWQLSIPSAGKDQRHVLSGRWEYPSGLLVSPYDPCCAGVDRQVTKRRKTVEKPAGRGHIPMTDGKSPNVRYSQVVIRTVDDEVDTGEMASQVESRAPSKSPRQPSKSLGSPSTMATTTPSGSEPTSSPRTKLFARALAMQPRNY